MLKEREHNGRHSAQRMRGQGKTGQAQSRVYEMLASIEQVEAGGSQGQPGLHREKVRYSSVAVCLVYLHKALGFLSSTFKRKLSMDPEF